MIGVRKLIHYIIGVKYIRTINNNIKYYYFCYISVNKLLYSFLPGFNEVPIKAS
jgi:hypothetical protein